MEYDSKIHHRRSIRLKGYDYSMPGAYFITLCVQHRQRLFGGIGNDEMRLNGAGKMIKTTWNEIPMHYPGIETDAFVIMPNHIHGIIVITQRWTTRKGQPQGVAPAGSPWNIHPGSNIRDTHRASCGDGGGGCVGAGPRACPAPCPRACPWVSSPDDEQPETGQPQGVAPTMSLPDVVHRFKTMTTKRYADGVKISGWKPFPGKLWQRNFWERVVRNESELNVIREYIRTNAVTWETDQLFEPVSGE